MFNLNIKVMAYKKKWKGKKRYRKDRRFNKKKKRAGSTRAKQARGGIRL